MSLPTAIVCRSGLLQGPKDHSLAEWEDAHILLPCLYVGQALPSNKAIGCVLRAVGGKTNEMVPRYANPSLRPAAAILYTSYLPPKNIENGGSLYNSLKDLSINLIFTI